MTQLSKLGVSRMFRAAIIHAVDYYANDPATMAAVDCLAESYISLDHLLDQLWRDPQALEFGRMGGLGIEYSPMKQSAVLLLTGRSWPDWIKFLEIAHD
jgi:hypothetical protein